MLTGLYFVEGMPWGFQAKALPMYLRTHNASLTLIGLTSLLSLPWMTKVLWAPLVDRYSFPSIGRRKSWIVPMQICIALAAFGGATIADGGNLPALLLMVGLMNLFSATMDIAVDGLAVDLLAENELGTGNITQVVGYKFGTLTAGGLLAWWFGDEHWAWLFAAMGILALVVCAATILFAEPTPDRPAPTELPDAPPPPQPQLSFRHILRLLAETLRMPGMPALLAVLATYKTGEQLIDSMFKPFLIDCGFTVKEVALWVSTAGMGASMAGSFLGGVLASRIPVLRALSFAAVFRAVPVGLVFLMSLHQPTRNEVIFVALTENFFGGLLTTTVFAYMMARTDKRIGATHFTLLSTIEMLGKAPIPLLAGPVAQLWGYSVLFGAGTVLSAGFLFLLAPLRRADAARLRDPA